MPKTSNWLHCYKNMIITNKGVQWGRFNHHSCSNYLKSWCVSRSAPQAYEKVPVEMLRPWEHTELSKLHRSFAGVEEGRKKIICSCLKHTFRVSIFKWFFWPVWAVLITLWLGTTVSHLQPPLMLSDKQHLPDFSPGGATELEWSETKYGWKCRHGTHTALTVIH